MDPLATRLSKLSVSEARKKQRQGRRAQKIGLQSPASGHRTPTSGLKSPASGRATPSSGTRTPANEHEFYTDEEEEEDNERLRQPFRFFDLPYELRRKILQLVMVQRDTVDLNVNATKRIQLIPVSRQFCSECSDAFYGGNTFRLLPLEGAVFKKRTRPLIQFFSARNRARITRLELRLGPHWINPPLCWQINDKLGLEDLVNLHRLDIIVQADPEHPSFEGFRKSKDFYTHFCGELVEEIFERAPCLETVYIDSWPAVGRDSPLLKRLDEEAQLAEKQVLWSSHLKIEDYYDVASTNKEPGLYDTVIIREMIIT